MTQAEFNAMLKTAISAGVAEEVPGGYYTLKVSGEEIDNALAGVIATAGLGTAPKYISNCNTATNTGWYKWDEQAANAPFANAVMQVISRVKGTSCVQIAFNMLMSTRVSIAIRRGNTSTGAWDDWEYLNPPMVEGVEYKTVERLYNLPVYTRLMNCGAMPNAGVTITPLPDGIAPTRVLRVVGRVTTECTLPTVFTNGNKADIGLSRLAGVVVKNEGNNYAGTVTYAQIWYTKD